MKMLGNCWLYILLQLIHPAAKLLAHLLGAEFYLYNETVYFLLIAAASTLLWYKRVDTLSTANLLVFPVTIFVCIYEILFLRSIAAVPTCAIRVILSYTYFSKVKDRWYKYLYQAVFVFLTIFYLGVSGFDLTFGTIGTQTIIQQIVSPDGIYTAQLIDDDQGALGGNTIIKIHQRDFLSLGFGGFRPKTDYAFVGEWGLFKNMAIDWEGEHTLLINGKVSDWNK